ncbi:outer membrane protein assembly factor BamD [Roseateles amylovorans]|uniref:Outer membrane protein assembly factor BamD n=1 Tax=Roseateles amylovorans TaxID=2978473 RepID=A0ABY6AZA9_9BURK|nr:outer membrane protein assembly factor BamD [Roseateles amylovorans]UXH77074.1 outer membrane protein assembly factor BamD [Roseateles amylovorans]
MIETWALRRTSADKATVGAGQPRTAWQSFALTAVMATVVGLSGCSSTPKEDPNSQANLEKLYAEAKEDMISGSYDRAIKSLERIEGRAAGTTLGQQAQLDLAWANYKSGERVQAVTVLDRFIKLNPSSPALDYALYMKGLVNFNDDLGLFGRIARQDISERDQQAARDSMQAFKQLVEQFPESKYSEDGRVRIDYITNSLAAYEVHVARYYFNRGAYLAAANRAQAALLEFQNAPALEEGLFIMAKSYDKLGLEQLRSDAERVLKASFPDSAYLAGGPKAKDKAWWQVW